MLQKYNASCLVFGIVEKIVIQKTIKKLAKDRALSPVAQGLRG
jgi:hypothetical protein